MHETKRTPTTSRWGTVAVLAVAIAASMGAVSPASASGGDAVEARGACSGSATWKLKAKHDDARIQIEYEVDANRVGQVWSVLITDNGSTVFSGTATTVAPSGSFEIRRFTANRAGTDTIRARASHAGQTCAGSVTL